MKKLVAVGLMASSLLAVAPKRSEAITGIMSLNPVAMGVGTVLSVSCIAGLKREIIGTKTLGRIVSMPCLGTGELITNSHAGAFLFALVGSALGIMMLDEKTNKVTMNEMTKEAALKLGISNEERDEFNEALERINPMLEDAVAAGLKEKAEKDAVNAVKTKWLEGFSDLSVGAQAALAKMGKVQDPNLQNEAAENVVGYMKSMIFNENAKIGEQVSQKGKSGSDECLLKVELIKNGVSVSLKVPSAKLEKKLVVTNDSDVSITDTDENLLSIAQIEDGKTTNMTMFTSERPGDTSINNIVSMSLGEENKALTCTF